MTVKNVKTSAQSSLASNQKATDANGQLTELGGVAPFTWANTTPKLPAGLIMTATGKITGTAKASSQGIRVQGRTIRLCRQGK